MSDVEHSNWEDTVHLKKVQTKYSAHPSFNPCDLRNPNLLSKNSGPAFSKCVTHRFRTRGSSGNEWNSFIPKRSAGSCPGWNTSWKSRTRIWIFRRHIWIPEITQIKTLIDTLGIRNTLSEYFLSALWRRTRSWHVVTAQLWPHSGLHSDDDI